MADASDSHLRPLLARASAGDAAAWAGVIEHSRGRLVRLARKMLHSFPRVHRWEDTDDVLQGALLRLLRALEAVRPQSVADYFALATQQLRRELLDLARHYYGPQGPGAHHASVASDPASAATPTPDWAEASSNDPGRLAALTEFHEHVAALPEPERQVVELLWYHGLTQAEAAEVLQISVPTVKRRWLAARLDLQKALLGEPPEA